MKRKRDELIIERRPNRRNRKSVFLRKLFCILLFLIGIAVCSVLFFVFTKKSKQNDTEKVTSVEEETVSETETETEPEMQPEFEEIVLCLEEHTISYELSGADRNHNMKTAAGTIDGYLLNPGEKFSWLEVVGNTTSEKGYRNGGSIQNGEPATELGGGVCQVSSTLYSAVYDAGVIQEGHYYARQHTVTSKYIDPDVDHEATVAIDHEPQTDFWFENTLKCPIIINAWTDGGTVTVSVSAIVYVKIQN